MFKAALIFAVAMAVGLVCVLAYSIYRAGSVRAAVAYYRENPVYKDWKTALSICVALVVALALAPTAKADEPRYDFQAFKFTEVYFGLDYQISAPTCRGGSIDDSLTANTGVRQHLAGWQVSEAGVLSGRIDLVASYTHHSCAIGSDINVYDGPGVMVVFRKEW